jgi:hypothetical protein
MVMGTRQLLLTTIGILTLSASLYASAQCPAERPLLPTTVAVDPNMAECLRAESYFEPVSTDHWRSRDRLQAIYALKKSGLVLRRFGEHMKVSVTPKGLRLHWRLGR